MKVALVHDYLIRFGGAERVLLELHKLYPEAPIYVLLYDELKMGKFFEGAEIRPSFLQKFPSFLRARHKYLLPFLPVAPETFDLREFDLVISSSSAFAKGVITRPRTSHINYCHNPAKFLWDYCFEYLDQQNIGPGMKLISKLMSNYLRVWDRAAAQRVDYFIANSKTTAGRIKKFYRREAPVIYPPVELPLPDPVENPVEVRLPQGGGSLTSTGGGAPEKFFLIVSQLTPYKKIDIAVEAFNRLELNLVVIGEGPQKKYLKRIAGPRVEILGWQDDEVVVRYFRKCAAFIFPGEDDFGIAPVEAMSFGKPVLALRGGGARETVIEGVTGEFFDAARPEILADGVRRLLENLPRYSPLVIRKRAEKFSAERFREEMREFINGILT